jgi:DUF971 family protein
VRVPEEIRRDGSSGIVIRWRDGTEDRLAAETLRRWCPCAVCREVRGEQSHAKPLTGGVRGVLRIVESTKEEEIHVARIRAIGNYAIGIAWGDGHDSGIYTFEYLADLAVGRYPVPRDEKANSSTD